MHDNRYTMIVERRIHPRFSRRRKHDMNHAIKPKICLRNICLSLFLWRGYLRTLRFVPRPAQEQQLIKSIAAPLARCTVASLLTSVSSSSSRYVLPLPRLQIGVRTACAAPTGRDGDPAAGPSSARPRKAAAGCPAERRPVECAHGAITTIGAVLRGHTKNDTDGVTSPSPALEEGGAARRAAGGRRAHAPFFAGAF